MDNNLYKVENTLRSIAKRYKSVKYSLGLAILFLMMGVGAFSEEVNNPEAVPTREEIATSKENLKNSVGSLQSKIDSARAENEKGLTGLKLELIQLMEQGDQVVKSPWASWQFGANYMYSKWNGTYKGRGDKSKKYPYEGVYTRSTNAFVRSANIQNKAQLETFNKLLSDIGETKLNGVSALNTDSANDGKEYGLLERKLIEEQPHTIQVSAAIRPRNIVKTDVQLNVTFNEITAPRPGAELSTPSTPSAPNISIPSFSPVAPNVEAPVIPAPPTFAVVLGADCNTACSGNEQDTKTGFLLSQQNKSQQNIPIRVRYTWPNNTGAEKRYAFKMDLEENLNWGSRPDTMYFNSYNFGYKNLADSEYAQALDASQDADGDRNNQYFFIGGSRFIEFDNNDSGTYEIPSSKTIHLGGILSLGFVVQDNGITAINSGKITDESENRDEWIKEMPTTPGKDYLEIKGPSYDPARHEETVYKIKRSNDGYVGYKVGMAQVQEDGDTGNKFYNKGTLEFYGERSIGMYSYLPTHTSKIKLVNEKFITMSGKESYGMRLNSHTDSNAEMINETTGVITLRKNPNSTKGDLADRADNSAAMALMGDATVSNKVSLTSGKAVNKGKINLQDNISNALGMFVNIDSDMTNQNEINISALAQKDGNGKYKPNVGMRADQVESQYSTAASFDTKVINDTAGKVSITGQAGIGMFASGKNTAGPNGKGTAQAINKGTITIDKNTETADVKKSKFNFGMLSSKEGKITNETDGKILVKESENSVGMASLIETIGGTQKVSKAENKGIIEASGEKTTGVYNTGEFLMDNNNAKISASAKQSIGVYAKGMDTNTKTILKAGTVTAANSGVGLYSDKSKITLDNTNGGLKLVADNGGLLFYNYQSDDSTNPSGKFELIGTSGSPVTARIKDGGYGFYLKNATITNGTVPGVTAFLNGMFTKTSSVPKLKMVLEDGGTLMILDKPQGGELTLTGVSTLQNINTSLGNNVEIDGVASGKYKVYSVYRGSLKMDQNVNLDNTMSTATPDAYYKVDFRSSNMTLDAGKTVSGTQSGQVALFQGNYDEIGDVGTVDKVKITNNGKILLSGNSGAKTTTAMAGDFVTLTNNKDVEVTGDKAVGMFGAGGSKVLNNTNGTITVGKEGVALYGVNKLGTSTLGDKTISLVNKGKITAVSGKESPYGIYAKNDLGLATRANAKVTNEGTIDFTSAKKSIGAYVEDATLINTGKMLVGEEGVGIFSKNSDVTSSGDVTLTKKAIAFNLDGTFTGRTLNFTSKITLTDDDNTIFNFKNATFDTTGLTGFTDNLNIVSNNKSYSYFSLKDSTLTYNRDKTFAGKNVKFVNSNTSKVDWRSNLTLNGDSNVAFYANGTSGAGPEVKIASGKTIKLVGDKTVGVYSAGGARVQNAGNIVVGSNGAALYSKDNGTLTNTGKITLGKNSAGIYLAEGAGSLSHSGAGLIESTFEGAKGIVVKSSSAGNFANNAKIKLIGASSIGIYSAGNARTFLNNGDIEVGDTTGSNQSVGIYMLNSGIVKNYKSVKAGNKSIGIYGKDISLENANSTVEVGDGATGIYSKDGNVDLKAGSKLTIGKTLGTNQEAVGLYHTGTAAGTINNNLSSLTIGTGSIGLVVAGSGATTLNNNMSNINLRGDAVYTYTSNTRSTVHGRTKITSTGDGNYGYYVAGNLTNYAGTGNMDFSSGTGNVGIYSSYSTGNAVARNYANINVGKTDLENELYSIGMAAGYTNKDNPSQNRIGHVINDGNITVGNENSIGMFASGIGSTAENRGNISITSKNGIGMFLEAGARGINRGNITIEAGAEKAIGVYTTGEGTIFKNYGTIEIKANNSKGVVTANKGSVETGSIEPTIASGVTGSKTTYEIIGTQAGNKMFGDKELVIKQGALSPTVVRQGNQILSPDGIDVNGTNLQVTNPNGTVSNLSNAGRLDLGGTASRIGMYVDTSGVNFTNPIQGLQYLRGLKKADLIIGAEAAEYTNAKTITVGKNILARYNKAIENTSLDEWGIISGSLTWAAAPGQMDGRGKLISVIMTKTDYKEYAGKDNNAYNFLDGLEQRYDKNALDSREKKVFNKLNGIGKNERILLSQAFDEMMGHQYANVQQRIQSTGKVLDKEFDYLRNGWQTVSKDSNKVKVFGTRGEYKTDTAGVIDYKNYAYGVAYVHENEDIKMGRGVGWYTGIVQNTFKFKDIGKSKEEQLQGKVGLLKSVPFDHNNSLNWTITGDIFVGYNKMHRKYLVVDDIFNAKARYYTYGIGVKNQLTKSFRLSEDFSLSPYVALNLEYGRVSKIREKSGEIKLQVKHNDYFSVSPEIGAELAFRHFINRKTLRVGLGVAYENELGRVANGKNKARVAHTNADWFNIRGEKEDRRGNVKFDLNLGLDNQRYGVTANAGYDTKGHNIRGGLGLRVIF
ncbi:autotransporter-associated N-terminal domain-containing protein [Fusobacterium animalis]|uniref:autotransporter-associated N-terminal domain-containing protein n=1 Tax=Fusobacterium animalis TaxID=76859 RepID=UPI001C6E25DC|nr:autotransporter-associated N-terminal domain-containing protein [Fusobacterium animalis]QYR65400.1 autotransporter-associated N-terminal domain-containing protein [Fusobacterium animalis]